MLGGGPSIYITAFDTVPLIKKFPCSCTQSLSDACKLKKNKRKKNIILTLIFPNIIIFILSSILHDLDNFAALNSSGYSIFNKNEILMKEKRTKEYTS